MLYFVLTIYKSYIPKIMMPSSFLKRRGENKFIISFQQNPINIKSLVPSINLLDLSASRASYPVN